MRNLETNEVSEVFELEYLAPTDAVETRWIRLDNPEMPDELLQEFITYTSLMLDKHTGKRFFADREKYLEQALELMWQELARRADGIKT